MPYSLAELQEKYPSPDTRTNILRLRGLARFLIDSIVVPKYRIPPHLHEPIKFTKAGEVVINSMKTSRLNQLGEIRLACFLEGYHEELFLDPDETDIDALREGLSFEINERRIIHPPMFDRGLYDRAFDIFDHGTLDTLSTEDTFRLLAEAEKGVFQCQDTVTGHFGALKSAEFRYIPPTDRVPLYHCHQRSCRAVHRTWLTTSHNAIVDARNKLDKRLSRTTQASDWSGFIGAHSAELTGVYDDMRSSGIVGLLGQCLTLHELREVVKLGFSGRSSELREVCSQNNLNVRNPDDFLHGVNRSGMMQLLLLLTDRSLTNLIDRATAANLVDIPDREIRTPKLIGVASGYFDISCRLSKYGIQYSSENATIPFQRLKRLIKSVYDLTDANDQKDLGWLLRAPEEEIGEALERYLNEERPRTVLQRLIFVGHRQYAKAANVCGITQDLSDRVGEDQLIEMMLWKLGYDLNSIESPTKDLRDLTSAMAEEVESHERFGVAEIRAIRSHSSPLFVALEDALDRALSYTAWATTHDHSSVHSPFAFDLKLARSHMARVLNSYAVNQCNPVEFNASGRNTLFPLISGFGVLASLLEEYESNSNDHAKASGDLPKYHKLSTLRKTAFLYSVPFLNLADESRKSIIRSLRAIAHILQSGGVLDVRNRLEHNREDFPTPEEFDACFRAINGFCDLVERRGLIPKQYRMIETRIDAAWRVRYVLEDSQGRTVEVNNTEGHALPGLPDMSSVQLIMSCARINGTGDYLRFALGSRSPYVEMWGNWPRYRLEARSAESLS